jgi:hypothetical protein
VPWLAGKPNPLADGQRDAVRHIGGSLRGYPFHNVKILFPNLAEVKRNDPRALICDTNLHLDLDMRLEVTGYVKRVRREHCPPTIGRQEKFELIKTLCRQK